MLTLLAELVTNPVFAGIAGGAGASAMLYQARALPAAAWTAIQRAFSVTLVVDNSEELFDRLLIYLSESPYARRARWLRMVELYDDEQQKWIWRASFGQGWHLFRDDGNWFLFHRHIQDAAKGESIRRQETLTVRTIGTGQEAVRAIMKRAESIYQRTTTTRVHVWHAGAYLLADRKPSRPLASVFLPPEQKARIVGDLDRFMASRDSYRQRGTPYRRGYLFEGPPGTGKTTLAFALACYAGRPIYIINLNTAGGDTGLQAAFNVIENGGVVVIEDIDSATISHDRTAPVEPEIKVDAEKSVTLSGLLNAIDGLASRENRILIVTSNHADKLDPALLRPGRIDRREWVGMIEVPEARAMTRAFLGDERGDAWFTAAVAPELPMSPAELQGRLLARLDSDEKIVTPLLPLSIEST